MQTQKIGDRPQIVVSGSYGTLCHTNIVFQNVLVPFDRTTESSKKLEDSFFSITSELPIHSEEAKLTETCKNIPASRKILESDSVLLLEANRVP